MRGNIDIGLYDDTSLGGLPGSGAMITFAIFHKLGTYLRRDAALVRLVSFILALRGSCLSASSVIRSKPGVVFGLILLLISDISSFSVVNLLLLWVVQEYLIIFSFVWLKSVFKVFCKSVCFLFIVSGPFFVSR